MDEPSLSGDVEQLARVILRYCVAYPDAKDTVEGILKWWVPPDRVPVTEQEVRKVLEALAEARWLIKREITPTSVYGLNKSQLKEIKTFLNG